MRAAPPDGAPAGAAADTGAPPASGGTVYDLGYTPHEGARLGRAGAIRAMIRDGSRRALGLRRKPWAKVLPWALIGAAIVPAAWVVALTFLVSGFSLEDAGPWGDPAEFFDMIGTLALLFVALVAPILLIPDRQHGVLAIYASRPVRAGDYLLARAATLLWLTAAFMLIPHAIVYVGISSLYVDGLWAGLSHHASEIPEILATTAAYVVGYGAPAFLAALFVHRVAIASGVFAFGMFLTGALADAMPRATELLIFKVLAPLSLFFNPLSVRDWLFERDIGGMPLDAVDLPRWAGAAAIVAVALVTAVLAHRRYRREF